MVLRAKIKMKRRTEKLADQTDRTSLSGNKLVLTCSYLKYFEFFSGSGCNSYLGNRHPDLFLKNNIQLTLEQCERSGVLTHCGAKNPLAAFEFPNT